MALDFWIDCDDGSRRMLRVDLLRYKVFTLRTDPMDRLLYYRFADSRIADDLEVEGGLWVAESEGVDADGEYLRRVPVRPTSAAYDFLRSPRFKDRLPADLESYRETASDQARFMAWLRSRPTEIVARVVDPSRGEDWITASQAAICRALGYSGTRAGHIKNLKSQGTIRAFREVGPKKFAVIFSDPKVHARVKASLAPVPRKARPRKAGPKT
jgi:hypothetical protein